MSAPAYMRFFVADYLADTMHLTTEQHGCYILLISAYWRNSGPISDDDEMLRLIARLSAKRWRKLRPVIAPLFQISQGFWHHKRIDAELKEVDDKHLLHSKNGKKGAAARWPGHVFANGPAMAYQSQISESDRSEPNGSSLPSSEPKGSSSGRAREARRRRGFDPRSPATKLFEGAMNAADAISDREEAAQTQHRSPRKPPPQPLLDRK